MNRCFKLCNEKCVHYGMHYKEGLNVDILPFNPKGQCQPGGLYYFTGKQILDYNAFVSCDKQHWIFDVEIPDDAQVYHENWKSKADKLILKNKRRFYICDIVTLFDPYMIANDYSNLFNHVYQTEELCLYIVRNDGGMLSEVHVQTDKICLEAVKQDGMALEYVKNQTEEICLEAVKQNGMALRYVKDQTDEICLEAVKNAPQALVYVKHMTPAIYKETVRADPTIKIHINLPSLKDLVEK